MHFKFLNESSVDARVCVTLWWKMLNWLCCSARCSSQRYCERVNRVFRALAQFLGSTSLKNREGSEHKAGDRKTNKQKRIGLSNDSVSTCSQSVYVQSLEHINHHVLSQSLIRINMYIYLKYVLAPVFCAKVLNVYSLKWGLILQLQSKF